MNPYKILGVRKDAPIEAIKKAYKESHLELILHFLLQFEAA